MKNTFFILAVLLFLGGVVYGQSAEVAYRCGEINVLSNQIKPHFIIKNTGTQSLSLADLTARYYYSKEGTAQEMMFIDHAAMGNSIVKGDFANGYVEFSFTSGTLAPGGDTGEIQARFSKTDWKVYNQANDFSFDPSISSFASYMKMTLFFRGTRIWGEEPPPPTPSPSPTPRVTPDPRGGDLEVLYMNGDSDPSDIQAAPYLKIKNNGTSAVAYEDLELRYYFTADSSSGMRYNCDQTPPGMQPHEVISSFVNTSGDDWYLSLKFNSSLQLQGESQGIKSRIYFDGAPLVDETNDYSYDSGAASFMLTGTVTLFYQDDLVWGFEPYGGPAISPTPSMTPPPYGVISLLPEPLLVSVGDRVEVTVVFETAGYKVVAYGIELTYDSDKLSVMTDIGLGGVVAGTGGFVSAVNTDTPGVLSIAGFDAQGKGPSPSLELCVANFKAEKGGIAEIVSSVDTLIDENYVDINIVQYNKARIKILHGDESGRVFFNPSNVNVDASRFPQFDMNLRVNTGDTLLGAYSFVITYDPDLMSVDSSLGTNGVSPGVEGFVAAVNAETDGEIRITGFLAEGSGPSPALDLCYIHFVARNNGTSPVDISVKNLASVSTATIGTPYGESGSVTVTGYVPPVVGGKVSFISPGNRIKFRDEFSLPVVVDTGDQDLGSYGLRITYEEKKVEFIRYTQGSEGFVSAFNDRTPGMILVAGFDAYGKGPDRSLELFELHFEAIGLGTTEFNIMVEVLLDSSFTDVGRPEGDVLSFFIDPPIEMIGRVFFNSPPSSAAVGEQIDLSVMVNTGFRTLTSYLIEIEYDPSFVDVLTTEGINGVTIGEDGFISRVEVLSEEGLVTIAGSGFAVLPDESLDFFTVHFEALEPGIATFDLSMPDASGGFWPPFDKFTGQEITMEILPAVTPPPPGGKVSIGTLPASIRAGEEFPLPVIVDTGDQALAAYDISIKYTSPIVKVQESQGHQGVLRGAGGFVSAVNNTEGEIRIVGFDPVGKGPDRELDLLSVLFVAQNQGSTFFVLSVDQLVDPLLQSIGVPEGCEASMVVYPAITPTPIPSAGKMSMGPLPSTVTEGDAFALPVTVDTGDQNLSMYDISIAYTSSCLAVQRNLGNGGVTTGSEGFVFAVSSTVSGLVVISGFDIAGKGPDRELDLLAVHFEATAPGTALLELTVDNLVDSGYSNVGIPRGDSLTLEIEPAFVQGGSVSIGPHPSSLVEGENLDISVLVDTGIQYLAAYDINFHYTDGLLSVRTLEGTNGVSPGKDGFIASANPSGKGVVSVVGFDVLGRGPDAELELFIVHFKAIAGGEVILETEVSTLVDNACQIIGKPEGDTSSLWIVSSSPTPTPMPEGGKVFFSSYPSYVMEGEDLEVTVGVDAGNQLIAAYDFDIYYTGPIKPDDVYPECDGFMTAVNISLEGKISVSGFEAYGKGPGLLSDFLKIHFETYGHGEAALSISVISLVDNNYQVVGIPEGENITINVNQWATPGGKVSIGTLPEWVNAGEKFDLPINVNTGTSQLLAAYVISLNYSADLLKLLIQEGLNGVSAGREGFLQAVNSRTPGTVIFAGYDPMGKGPDTELELAMVHFRAINQGTAAFIVEVESLSDPDYKDVGFMQEGDQASLLIKPCIIPPGGKVSLSASSKVSIDDTFSLLLSVDTGEQNLAAYAFNLFYNASLFSPTGEIVVPAPRGFLAAFNSSEPGVISVAGFDSLGKGPDSSLDLLLFYFKAIAPGGGTFDLEVEVLNDSSVEVVGVPEGDSIVVVIEHYTPTPSPIIEPTATPSPPPPGGVYFIPSEVRAAVNDIVELVVAVNTGDQRLAAFGFTVTYDAPCLTLENVTPQLIDPFPIIAVPSIQGRFSVTGFDALGKGPAMDQELFKIELRVNEPDPAVVSLSIDTLLDPDYNTIGTPLGGSAVINPPVPTPSPEPIFPGTYYILPGEQSVLSGDTFPLKIMFNSGEQIAAAYGIRLDYNPAIIRPADMDYLGVEAGADGFFNVVEGETPGVLRVAGFDVTGKGPGENLHLLTLNMTAVGVGSVYINLTVEDSVDDKCQTIEVPYGKGAIVNSLSSY